MNYLNQINFNKECISLYMKENIDKIYNTKIYSLINENIELYSKLSKLKKKAPKQEKTYEKTTYKNMFKVGVSEYKENTIESFYGSYDNYLLFDKV